jgi:hypothetical protein
VSTSHFGAVAAWWQRHKGDLAKEAIIGLVVGVLLLIGGWVWDARLQARQEALERAIGKPTR